MAKQIYPCIVCKVRLTNDVIRRCELCKAVFHKSCTKMTKQQSIFCKNGIYYCLSCCTVFPFQNIADNEFTFENSSVEANYDLYKLKDNCLQFDINSFKYSDCNPCDFENDIDPYTNFYNNLTSKCEYYTDSKFTEKIISMINGLSFIHFNARCLNKNFQKIKDYVLELVRARYVRHSQMCLKLDVSDKNDQKTQDMSDKARFVRQK